MICMKTILSIFLIFTIFTNVVLGQDIHFSQFYDSPLYLNPSLSGNPKNDYRFTIGQRTQWRSVTIPYSTISASFDAKYLNLKKDFFWGYGILINADKAGDAEFGHKAISIPVALHRFLTKDSLTSISFGVSPGLTGISYDFSKLIFDSQFDGETYNPGLPSGISIPFDTKMYFDLSLGFSFNKQYADKQMFEIGFSVAHLNTPGNSFFKDDIPILHRKFSVHSTGSISLSEILFLQPLIFAAHQNTFNEIVAGSMLSLRNKNSDFSDIAAGLMLRPGDALISVISLQYRQTKIGLSYDFNFSSLRKASKGMGGMELILKYDITKAKKIVPTYHSCPSFF